MFIGGYLALEGFAGETKYEELIFFYLVRCFYYFIRIGAYEDLATHLLDSTEILTKNWNILDNVLETLDVQQHSLGVMYVLIAKFNSLPV